MNKYNFGIKGILMYFIIINRVMQINHNRFDLVNQNGYGNILLIVGTLLSLGVFMKYGIIHIADIHYKKNESEGSNLILHSFLDDIQNQIMCNKEITFYLAITGDIVFEGKDSESYESIKTILNDELNKIGLTKNYRIVIPGNHDVDQNVVNENIIEYKDKIYSNYDTEGNFNNLAASISLLNQKFENYELFESDFAKYGVDFASYGKGWEIDKDLGCYCLNTALCSFGGVEHIKDDKKLAICTRKLVEWCNTKKTKTNILLMHHPVNILVDWSVEELKQIIDKNFTLCLSGHNHKQDLFYNKLTKNSIICSAPPLFTSKKDKLGYSIVIIEDNAVTKIIYRQYIKGKFLNGSEFSENDDGIIILPNTYDKLKEINNTNLLKLKLSNALEFFKGRPTVFIEPKISREREFNNEENLLFELIDSPYSAIIVAQPQFGFTCLAHYMRLESYKKGAFWIYIDAKVSKNRKVLKEIEEQLSEFDKINDEIKCIIIDAWDPQNIDHQNILNSVDEKYEDIPIIVLSSYIGFSYNSDFDFTKLNHQFRRLHLQALQRDKVRDFVTQYNQIRNIADENVIVEKVVKDMEALNIHRTPVNCHTLLRVLENNFTENMINRTKMIKAVLFILFTDAESFSYASKKPDVEDVEYLLGKLCMNFIKNKILRIKSSELFQTLKKYADDEMITVDIKTIINIMIENNILIENYGDYEFKHTYWIFYFAGTYMLKNKEFADYILNNKNYINYPEVIEFYTGTDGQRENAIGILLNDTVELITAVNSKIGIPEEYNPLGKILWEPSSENIEEIRLEISTKVQKSNLPVNLKDQHADMNYNSEAPYSQTINYVLSEYSVLSLMQNIKASSRALRNSNYIQAELKLKMLEAILKGWEQISRVIFWLSPVLAYKGSVSYDGFGLYLTDEFNGDYKDNLRDVYLSNLTNVVNYVKDDISANKIGGIFYKYIANSCPNIKKQFIALFLISERPEGWYDVVFNYMNQLHIKSYYMGNLYNKINKEIQLGFATDKELIELRNLLLIVTAKFDYAPKGKIKEIPENMVVNKQNELPIDKIMAASKNKYLS